MLNILETVVTLEHIPAFEHNPAIVHWTLNSHLFAAYTVLGTRITSTCVRLILFATLV